MSAITVQHASVLNGRQMMFAVVVGLHAVVIGSLMAMRIAVDDKPEQKVVFTVFNQPVEPLPPPPPTIKATDRVVPIDVPTVPVIIERPEEPTWIAQDPEPLQPVEEVVGATGRPGGDAVVVRPTELSYQATRSPDDYYPATSLSMQEQGVAIVQVCVGPNARLEGRPTIQRSSGSRRLDEAAVRWASEALAFTPATRNGAPISACKGFRVNFSLR